MLSKQQVGNAAVCQGQKYRTMACPTWLCMLYSHRIFFVLNIFHDPIWGLVANEHIYLTISPHEVLHADRKMKIPGAKLLHMTF